MRNVPRLPAIPALGERVQASFKGALRIGEVVASDAQKCTILWPHSVGCYTLERLRAMGTEVVK